MIRKFTALFLILVMVLSFGACGSNKEKKSGSDATCQIAVLTNAGAVDNDAYVKTICDSVAKYAKKNQLIYKNYESKELTTDTYLKSITKAVKDGAEVILTTGELYGGAVYMAQDKYPDVKFVSTDGRPFNEDYTDRAIGKNTTVLKFGDEQAGYLAGYAAVRDGYRRMGFIGGSAVASVINYGYGFVQGADAAARRSKVKNVSIKYHYTGDFMESQKTEKLAASWYKGGTQVIFACGGALGNSVMAAAEKAETKVIGVDVDQSSDSDTVITSAMKGLDTAVKTVLKQCYGKGFPGGKVQTLDASNEGVQLPMKTSKFKKFTEAEYSRIYAKLAKGKIKIRKANVKSADKLGTKTVTIQIIK